MTSPSVHFVQPPDLEALPEIYTRLAEVAIEELHAEGEVKPALMLLSVPPGAREPAAIMAVDPKLVHALQRNADTKSVLMAFVRSALDPEHPLHVSALEQLGAHPNLVAHVSEAWYVAEVRDERAAGPSTLRDYAGSLGAHPQRREAVFVALHSMRGSVLGMCPMTRDSAGKPTAVIEQLKGTPGDWTGRFDVHSEGTELGVSAEKRPGDKKPGGRRKQ
jgi:hypothetical protein